MRSTIVQLRARAGRRIGPHAAPLGLVLGAYLLALVQRPGETIADTKVHLQLDAARFLGDVASAWTPTAGLGHVWAGQYGGYLFPMGPFFAAGEALGLPDWVVHRLWLGTLLAVAAYGILRLLRVLVPGHAEHGYSALHVGAGVLYVVNPYVTVYADRTSVALLAYAALPWLLLCVHRGLRDPRGWWWPAAFALVLTSTGGGVNAAVTGWVLVAPALLVLYELGWGGVPRAALVPWLGRTVLTGALAGAWWVVPLAVHASQGFDFLPFTEQPGTIWGTTSLAESLRLLGFWTSYIGVGFGGELRPFATHGPAYLFSLPVVLASMLVPALVVLGLRVSWRARYAPFFVLLLTVGLLIMAVGFPEGSPLRRAATFTYNQVEAVRFLRTTYKAGPLVALALAALGGMGLAWAWARAAGRPRLRALGTVALAGVVAVAAWPLTSGRAPDRQLAYDVPSWWQQAADRLDDADPNTRALLLPGQLFASYRWGQTIDAVLPALTDHPVANRYIVPFSDPRATELQWGVDALVNQERLVPGQLAPLLDLLGVGQVVLATDGDRSRSGELGPAEVARVLGTQPDATGGGLAATGLDTGLGAPEIDPALGGGAGIAGERPVSGVRRETFGTPQLLPAAAARLAGPVRRAPLELRPARTGGIVRVVPRAPMTIVDGGAQGVMDLAAFGDLRPDRPLAYAPDLDGETLAAAVRDGAGFVIADGVRRRAFVSARLRGNVGPTLPADRDVSEDGTRLDPFSGDGDRPAAQTVAVLRGRGAVAVSAPYSPQVTQFPEHRPAAALDGDLGTAWLADRFLAESRRHLDVTFPEPRDVGTIELYPYGDSRGTVTAVEVGGRRFAVRPGWNTLRVGLEKVRRLSVRIASMRRPERATAGGGGIRELRIPGVRVRETLRPPVVLEQALRSEDLSGSPLTYLLQRTTADAPAVRGRLAGPAQAGLLADARDPEPRLERTIHPPTARRYGAEAWVSVDPKTPDDVLDGLVSPAAARLVARSASRLEGRPRHRASGAFDGGTARAWIGQWIAGRPAWLSWRTPQVATLRRLRLVPPAVRVRRPTRVRLRSERGVSAPVAVRADGFVRLAAPLVGRRFRLEVLEAAFPAGTPARLRQRRAVGIGELRGAGVEPVPAPRSGRAAAPCGAVVLRAAGRTLRLRVPAQDLRRFDAGLPLRAEGCGPLSLPADRTLLRDTGTGAFRADRLRLFSAPPESLVLPGAGGRVLAAGTPGEGRRDGVRVDVREPSWLVYGESYAAGWRASCDGRDLGRPVPLQGYANAWPVEPGCERVSLSFGPQRALTAGYVVSAIAILLLLAYLLLRRGERVRQRDPVTAPPGPLDVGADRPARWGLLRALAMGLLASGVLGALFALRAGAVLGPVVAFVLWRGVANRTLVLWAGLLLLVGVPVAHVLGGADDPGGYDYGYAVHHIAAHWVATGAVALLLLALVRWLRADRRLRRADDAG
ncbi:DUF3367 domain-containing protein [Conexibacter sp. W3-3-2]|uniref:alpha-(1->3)-arabinofuranosyltransferase domain-containing protein n=1 Tax=Conexibacter sp. W3-3-2 TaxID=2675227 RepID=UPI00132857D0|nr:alpha-(1->3)-arabinofuranosyltransferase family protein [Conexibacter sp. W3-3-2]MTD42889.1 DUF3367 domain-containing protein [Conexibacter sp. W3-3-2]